MTQRPSLIGTNASGAGGTGAVIGGDTTAAGAFTGSDGISVIRTTSPDNRYSYTIPDNGSNYTVHVNVDPTLINAGFAIQNKTATSFDVLMYTEAGTNVIRLHSLSILING